MATLVEKASSLVGVVAVFATLSSVGNSVVTVSIADKLSSVASSFVVNSLSKAVVVTEKAASVWGWGGSFLVDNIDSVRTPVTVTGSPVGGFAVPTSLYSDADLVNRDSSVDCSKDITPLVEDVYSVGTSVYIMRSSAVVGLFSVWGFVALNSLSGVISLEDESSVKALLDDGISSVVNSVIIS